MMRNALLFGLMLVLAACSGGNVAQEQTEGQLGAFIETFRVTREKRQEQAPLPELSRAQLDQVQSSLLLVSIESSGNKALLAPFSRRTDPLPGAITVWRAGDGAQVVLRNGVLTGTRGVGNDLASADVAFTVAALQGHAASQGPRSHYLRRDDHTQARLSLNCTITDLGPTTLTIVEKPFRTRHLRESCVHPTGQVENEYWIELSDGAVRKSRQWAGPELGYFNITLLKK